MSDIFTPTDVNQTPVENAFENLVGEGKKFKDVEALAKGKLASDNYILELQAKLAEAETKANRAQTLEDVKNQILSGLRPQESNQQQPTPTPAQPVNDSDLETKLNQLLEARTQKATAESNRALVQKTLSEKLGADAQIVLQERARELGLSLDYLAKVANDSPQAFFRLTGLDQKPQAPVAPAPRGTVTAPAPTGSVQRNHAYYENLKRTDINKYLSREVRAQQMEDALRMGDAYFN